MFKSAEEKEAERREREAEQARAAEQQRLAAERQARDAFLATPVGGAPAAKEAGRRFYEIQLQVGANAGNASWGMTDSNVTVESSAGILEEIERIGWRLEHANYFFMITGETSSQRVFMTGEATAINGVTVGAYIFRNTDETA